MTELPPLPKPPTVGTLINYYIELRDQVTEIKNGHKEELAPFNERMMKLELIFQKLMQENNLENLKADGGTAYKSEQDSVTVADWDVFLEWVLKHKAYHFLEQRAQKSSVKELLDSEGVLPPGVNRKSVLKINVRRS